MEKELIEALKMAIQALNIPKNFNTWIQNPKGDRPYSSYALIPVLEGVLKRAEEAIKAPEEKAKDDEQHNQNQDTVR